MKILAADTSTSVNTVALCDGDRVLAEASIDGGRTHSERLLEMVDWTLEQSQSDLSHVGALAISVGPGSFTGLRIGVAAFKGLALARNLRLIPVPTLDAMTRLGLFQETIVCPLLDARMDEVFAALYRFEGGERERLTEDLVCSVHDVLAALRQHEPTGKAAFLGDGAARYEAEIREALPGAVFAPGSCSFPRAAAVAREAVELLAKGALGDASKVSPVYLRKSQPEEAFLKKSRQSATP